MGPRFLSVKQVLDRICLSKTELYERLKRGEFPPSIPLGPKKVVFLEAEILQWMDAQASRRGEGSEKRRGKAQKAVSARLTNSSFAGPPVQAGCHE
jgi:prophage regulatory protein